ncbi:MAG TPA: ATP synthase F1 subunit gamma [Candidatus Aminicenantes bacterium]|nr:ATP synthase F1 subunit gamma [Candidatus Aminicenantes bacterium]
MAGNLISLRRRIRSVRNNQKITRAMKTVSAAKLRRASGDLGRGRPFLAGLKQLLAAVGQAVDPANQPLLQSHATGKVLLVVIASDKGLCGSFNTKVLKRAEEELASLAAAGETVELVAVGTKVVRHFTKKGMVPAHAFPGLMSHLTFDEARQIFEILQGKFLRGEAKSVVAVSTDFVSASRQEVKTTPLFPLELDLEGDTPGHEVEYILEPGAEGLLKALLPRYVQARFYQVLLGSSAAEHAARMLAMDLATRNASDMLHTLTLTMNKIRQASITGELLEIITATEALNA